MTRESPGMRRLVVGVLSLALLAGACSSASDDAPQARSGGLPAEPTAGTWKTWVLASADQIKVPAPPAAGSEAFNAERAEVEDLAARRTPQMKQDAHHWSDYPAIEGAQSLKATTAGA